MKTRQFIAATEDQDIGLIEVKPSDIKSKLDDLVIEFRQTITLRHPVTDHLEYRRRFSQRLQKLAGEK